MERDSGRGGSPPRPAAARKDSPAPRPAVAAPAAQSYSPTHTHTQADKASIGSYNSSVAHQERGRLGLPARKNKVSGGGAAALSARERASAPLFPSLSRARACPPALYHLLTAYAKYSVTILAEPFRVMVLRRETAVWRADMVATGEGGEGCRSRALSPGCDARLRVRLSERGRSSSLLLHSSLQPRPRPGSTGQAARRVRPSAHSRHTQ